MWLRPAATGCRSPSAASTARSRAWPRIRKKVEARLNLEHLARLREATGLPLVLHGGSGIRLENVLQAVKRGIAKINIGTEIRQAYEQKLRETGSVPAAQDACYDRTTWLLRDHFGWSGDRAVINPSHP